MQTQKTSLKKYVALSAAAYLLASFISSNLFSLTLLASSYAIVSIPPAIVAGLVAGYFFFKDHGRASTKEENRSYALHALLWGILLPSLLMAGNVRLFHPMRSFCIILNKGLGA